jgi:fructose-bisphosphate aldolase class I
MGAQNLIDTARAMVADGNGLPAMDENNPTCNKRFASLGIPHTEPFRRAYRKLIVTTRGWRLDKKENPYVFRPH